jgi:HPr kinase/phosphorylase
LDLKEICALGTNCTNELLSNSKFSFKSFREILFQDFTDPNQEFVFINVNTDQGILRNFFGTFKEFIELHDSGFVSGLILHKVLYYNNHEIFNKWEEKVPVIYTSLNYAQFKKHLFSYLSNKLSPYTYIHGSCVEVFGEGVLLVGKTGVGKSECVYELIRRGHNFVADDLIKLFHFPYSKITATSGAREKKLSTFIDLKYVGVLDLELILGPARMKEKTELSIIMELSHDVSEQTLKEESLDIFGIQLPYYKIPSQEKGRLATIIETIVLRYKLKKLGLDAVKIFEDILKEKHD